MKQTIAKHVMSLHMGRENQEVVGEIDLTRMKRYIAYAKRSAISSAADSS